MGKITCQDIQDKNDILDCLDEDWQNTGMCRYCWDMEEHDKAIKLLEKGDD